ncbi:MAG TPA: STAS domain-containing protein [Gemmatimonadaceae bacterium]|nr:STAS domain-containing protein [Gemmatimonadaceae bacterium]
MGIIKLSNSSPRPVNAGAAGPLAERTTPSDEPHADCPTLVTPPRLVAATRDEFRAAALDLLERATATRAPVALVDMGQTLDMDASGLGILVLLHKRAKERGIVTRLLHTPEHVRRLLALTKLEYLFEYEERAA